jgi:signal recognition particle receptor subunit beta
MGSFDRAAGEIHAKIVYYGPPGVGLTSNVEYVHRKLRREHRGELKRIECAGAACEFLPVELGHIKDIRTSIEVYTVPSGEAQRERRRELLTDVDGIVFVADLRPARHEATAAALQELRELLESHQRSLEDVALVVQYNRRDLADENALDRLHRLLDLRSLATFEAVASEGAGVLQTLSSLAKLILNRLRSGQMKPAARTTPKELSAPAQMPAPAPEPSPAEPLAAPAPAPASPASPLGAPAAAPLGLDEPVEAPADAPLGRAEALGAPADAPLGRNEALGAPADAPLGRSTEPADAPAALAPSEPAVSPADAPAAQGPMDLFAAEGPSEAAEADPFAAQAPGAGSIDLFAAQGAESFEEPAAGADEPWVTAEDSQEFSGPLVAEPAQPLDGPPLRFQITEAGPGEAIGGELRIPIRLREESSGRSIDLRLRLTIDPA